MKKNIIRLGTLTMIFTLGLILSACSLTRETKEGTTAIPQLVCADDEMADHFNNVCLAPIVPHAEKLKNDGRTITFDNRMFHYGDENLDYSDDERELWDVSSYNWNDVIVFPDEVFHDVIRKILLTISDFDYEGGQEITFGDLQKITRF